LLWPASRPTMQFCCALAALPDPSQGCRERCPSQPASWPARRSQNMLSQSTLLVSSPQPGDNIASAPSCDHLVAPLRQGTHTPTVHKAALYSTAVLTPLLFELTQARADAIAATRELEARALKARARQHLQERLRGGAAAGPAPCAADDTPCRVADRLYVGAQLPTA